jgi:tetratricopeptide (TPR) repeat protein
MRWGIIFILGLAIYAQTLGFGFVFDDRGFIVENPYITKFTLVPYLWKVYPLTRTLGFYSFAFNYWTNKLDPVGYHLLNVLIHFLAVGLVWALAVLIFQIAKMGKKGPEMAFAVALLFLVHPGQTEAVAYVGQRFESLATVFYLASLYLYLLGRTNAASRMYFFIGSALAAILGILTKETAATIPLTILAAEFILLKSLDMKKFLMILAAGGGFFFLFTRLVGVDLNIFFNFHPIASQSHDGDIITLQGYLLTQLRVFLTFMRLLILPINQNLDYDYPLSTRLFNPPLTFVGLCLMAGMIFAILKLRRSLPVIAFGLSWILITFSINLAPRSNVIFEHKLYLISFGFFLGLVTALFSFIQKKNLVTGILIAVIAILSVTSFFRNRVWESDLTLLRDVIQKSPHKARPYDGLGNALNREGYTAEAMASYNKAIELKPDFADAYYNRGSLYEKAGQLTQAFSDLNKAIFYNPNFAEAYSNRGSAYFLQGNLRMALADYNKALSLNPNYSDAANNRVAVLRVLSGGH